MPAKESCPLTQFCSSAWRTQLLTDLNSEMPPNDALPSDLEKGLQQDSQDANNTKDLNVIDEPEADPIADLEVDSTLKESKFFVWSRRVERLFGIESRGIHRVLPSERSPATTLSFLQIVILWMSINTAAQNVTLGSLGPGVYDLGFTDAACLGVFGGIVGSIPVAYTAIWGPWSGNRTLVCSPVQCDY